MARAFLTTSLSKQGHFTEVPFWLVFGYVLKLKTY